MKALIISILLISSGYLVIAQSSCLPEGITFETQALIDSFKRNYPGCTMIQGDVLIMSESITNLDSLNVLTAFGGSLEIIGTYHLNTLSGLEGLSSIGGDLILWGNDSLENFSGLENLDSIGGYLEISQNPLILTTSTLEDLCYVGGSVFIGHVLPHWVYGNYLLEDLYGLQKLDTIRGDLVIGDNRSLTSFSGLDSLEHVTGKVTIYGTRSITEIIGLGNLRSTGGLQLRSNMNLSDIQGLSNLVLVSGDLDIEYNYKLESLSGLENIDADSIHDLTIAYNDTLSVCSLPNICDFLSNPKGTITIHNNHPGCGNIYQLADECGVTLSCLPYGNYIFHSQAEIDSFPSYFPGCIELGGSVSIVASEDIIDLSPLGTTTSIAGDLTIWSCDSLHTLSPFENLGYIGGSLVLGDNARLDSLTGLENIDTIDGNLEISDHLVNLRGLEGLIYVGGDLKVKYCSVFSLEGLENLEYVGGKLDMYEVAYLSDLQGLNNLQSLGQGIGIVYCDLLDSLTGLEGIISIGGDITIWSNENLQTINALNNLQWIPGGVSIGENPLLQSLNAFDAVEVVEEGLNIFNNGMFQSLDAFHSLDSIGGDLVIDNPLFALDAFNNLKHINGCLDIDSYGLTSIEELSTLESISGYLSIRSTAISSIQALGNIDPGSISDLYLHGNYYLCDCAVESICNYLASPNGVVRIYNNKTGCNTPGEIAKACGFSIPCLPYGDYYLWNQADIDNFPRHYPACSDLNGNLNVQNLILNLDSLYVITSVGGDMYVGNGYLANLRGLENLNHVGGNLTITGGEYFISLSGLGSLHDIGEDLNITQTWDVPDLFGLSDLSMIGGDLDIYFNSGLQSLTGIENLSTLGGSLVLKNNDALTDLHGMENLTDVGYGIFVRDHANLESLKGIDNINGASLMKIIIDDNDLLAECAVKSICEYLAAPGAEVTIEDNAAGCNSVEEVLDSCQTVNIREFQIPGSGFQVWVYPNPVFNQAIIEYELDEPAVIEITFINHLGQRVKELNDGLKSTGKHHRNVDLANLPSGLYILKIASGSKGCATKFIKR